MKLFNTMSMQKEEFVPIEPGKVRMYACGPTVYNYIHVGNARPIIMFDVLRRYLEYRGYEVTFVQNFTDVDDKIIKRANEEGITSEEVTKKYIAEYFTDAHALGVREATVHPKATENIQQIIDLITTLIDKGYAYEVNGDVYYRTLKFKDYGKLSHQPIEDLQSGARIDVNDIKENPYNIQFVETEAASVPRTLSDVDAAVINGNYALGAGLDPSTAFAAEGADSQAAQEYGNVVAVRSGDEKSTKTEALLAALQSQKVSDFITSTYSGTVVPVFTVVDDIPQATGDDTTIKVGASPTPHAEILNAAKDLLAAKGWTLEVVEFTDYVQPNVALSDGSLDANYFQHQPYLDNYNEENGTDLVGVAKIHFEAMALYGGKAASLDDLKK